MDNIKEELKTLYPDENLTDEELNKMAERLVQFFELGMKFFLKDEDYYVWKPKK